MSHALEFSSALSAEEMAAVVSAIGVLTSTTHAFEEPHDTTPAWRFSGRWYEQGRKLS